MELLFQAAKLVLKTAALKDSMKEKQGVNEVEETLRKLGEAMGFASKELGFRDPTEG